MSLAIKYGARGILRLPITERICMCTEIPDQPTAKPHRAALMGRLLCVAAALTPEESSKIPNNMVRKIGGNGTAARNWDKHPTVAVKNITQAQTDNMEVVAEAMACVNRS